jgi:glycosyltransferase involved in cell wall biosynthesis
MDYKCSYIIPFKYSEDRIKGLLKVIENIYQFVFEIIIVEVGLNPSSEIISKDRMKHICVQYEGPFNKCKLMNLGFKHSSGNYVVFGDADCLIQPDKLLESFEFLKDYGYVCPKSKVIDLTENESVLNTEDIFTIQRDGRDFTPISGGISIFTRESFETIKGWPEEFLGWGKEDYAMDIKISSLLKIKVITNNLYHIYHTKENPNPYLLNKNFENYSKYFHWNLDELKTYIDSINI